MVKGIVTLTIGVFMLSACWHTFDGKLFGSDYRLFSETPVWELAQAVKRGDTAAIRRIAQNNKTVVDYQEPVYGQTLLIVAVANHHYESATALLDVGADPNKHNFSSGSSAIIDAAGIYDDQGDNTRFLKLLLSYGGNPNDEETGPRKEGNTTRNTPLQEACFGSIDYGSPIEKVKLLVKAGADVNHKNEYNLYPLQVALMFDHYDVALYLLNQGAKYDDVIIDRTKFSKDGKKIYIAEYLREQMLPLESEGFKQKMAVVAFLQQHGIDYWKTPIPDYMIEEAKKKFPDSWQEYLKVY